MTYPDAYPEWVEHSLTGNWNFRTHKRWFGLFPDVLVLEVQVVGYEDEGETRVVRWRDATINDVRALGLTASYLHG